MATSKNMTPELLSSQGSLKGLHLVATGDAFHQGWLNMIEEATEEVNQGVFRIRENEKVHNEFLQEEIQEGLPKNIQKPILFSQLKLRTLKEFTILLFFLPLKQPIVYAKNLRETLIQMEGQGSV
jgi:hypothetical protein